MNPNDPLLSQLLSLMMASGDVVQVTKFSNASVAGSNDPTIVAPIAKVWPLQFARFTAVPALPGFITLPDILQFAPNMLDLYDAVKAADFYAAFTAGTFGGQTSAETSLEYRKWTAPNTRQQMYINEQGFNMPAVNVNVPGVLWTHVTTKTAQNMMLNMTGIVITYKQP